MTLFNVFFTFFVVFPLLNFFVLFVCLFKSSFGFATKELIYFNWRQKLRADGKKKKVGWREKSLISLNTRIFTFHVLAPATKNFFYEINCMGECRSEISVNLCDVIDMNNKNEKCKDDR